MVNKDPRLTQSSINKEVVAFISKHTQIKWLGSVDVHLRINGLWHDSILSQLIKMYQVAVDINDLPVKISDKKFLFDSWCRGWSHNKIISIGKDLEESKRKRLGYTAIDLLGMPPRERKAVLSACLTREEFFKNSEKNTNSTPADIVVPTVENVKQNLENIKRLRLNPSGVTHTVSPNCGSSDGWTL